MKQVRELLGDHGKSEVPTLEDDMFWPGALSGGRENTQANRESF